MSVVLLLDSIKRSLKFLIEIRPFIRWRGKSGKENVIFSENCRIFRSGIALYLTRCRSSDRVFAFYWNLWGASSIESLFFNFFMERFFLRYSSLPCIFFVLLFTEKSSQASIFLSDTIKRIE